MTRDEVRKETDELVDASVKHGNDLNASPIEIAFINGPFRSFLHVLDDAQALEVDANHAVDRAVALVANMIKVVMQRTVQQEDLDGAIDVGQDIINQLSGFMNKDIHSWFKRGKPN